jgi:hypothetical protein
MSYIITTVEHSQDGKHSVMVTAIRHDDGGMELVEVYEPSPVIVFPRYRSATIQWMRELTEWGVGPLTCKVGT